MMAVPNPRLEAALQYAGRGWRIIPLHGITRGTADGIPNNYCTCSKFFDCKTPGKHPRIRTGRAFAAASADPQIISNWWRRWPNSNVGIATGRNGNAPPGTLGLCVVDIDGPEGLALLQSLAKANSSLPRTLSATSGRAGGGIHLYYLSQDCPQSSGDHLDSRGDGGLVVAPPSIHATGATYAWIDPLAPLSYLPLWLALWLQTRTSGRRRPGKTPSKPPDTLALGPLPDHLRKKSNAKAPASSLSARLRRSLSEPVAPADIIAALAAIPNPDLGWDQWNRIGMAAFASDPGAETLKAFEAWSRKSEKFEEGACEERWLAYSSCPPMDLGFGTLCYLAKEAVPGWQPPSHAPRAATPKEVDGPLALPAETPVPQKLNGELNGHHALPSVLQQGTSNEPLISLNKKYAVIGDVGGKCLVLGWVTSKVDATIKVPSFQSFQSFTQRYSHEYIQIHGENKQIGQQWLKWTGRKTYEGIDLVPNAPPILENNYLNLWNGFAVQPVPGHWGAMREHICNIVANGDANCADYIFRYMAWSVQHPGERAETALVLRGGKGAGKGTFARALKRLFGQHGLHISSSRHLVGTFNAHLRNCLLLLADEAFWAGDKQGESVLKAMLTEPTLMIEHKGVDAQEWVNRLHVIMLANSEWVVPASHDERRYAMFDVSNAEINNRSYFNRLNNEMANGGLAAMLHDLLRVSLGDWHPRQIPATEALQGQKARSLDAKAEWLESVLQAGEIPAIAGNTCNAIILLNQIREAGGRHARDITANALGRFLKSWDCMPVHRAQGAAWRFKSLSEMRQMWERKYGRWKWDMPLQEWNEKKELT